MIKLNILNLNGFLDTLNSCTGSVEMTRPDGTKANICRSLGAQTLLREEFYANKGVLHLTLTFTDPRDYFKIVNYYIGES